MAVSEMSPPGGWLTFVTFKRSDGVEKIARFPENEPGWILIHPSESEKEWWKHHPKGLGLPPMECFYRWDLNKREHEPWEKRLWAWIKKEMEEFSEGMSVRVYRENPYRAVGGLVVKKELLNIGGQNGT